MPRGTLSSGVCCIISQGLEPMTSAHNTHHAKVREGFFTPDLQTRLGEAINSEPPIAKTNSKLSTQADDAWCRIGMTSGVTTVSEKRPQASPVNQIKITLNLMSNVICCKLPFCYWCVPCAERNAGIKKCLTYHKYYWCDTDTGVVLVGAVYRYSICVSFTMHLSLDCRSVLKGSRSSV